MGLAMRLLAGLALLAAALSMPAAALAQPDKLAIPDKQAASPKQVRHKKAPAAPPPPVIVQDYQPDPALWLLADEDTSIYLFGTFHLLPRGFRWRSAQFDAVAAAADELVVESTDDAAETAARSLLAPVLAAAMDAPRISQRLSPESGSKWLALIELAGAPPEALDRLPLLFSLLALGMWGYEEAGSSHEFGVETVLTAEFAAAGKPVGSIESAAQVIEALLTIDEAAVLAELETVLAGWDGTSLAVLETIASDPAAGPAEQIDPFAMEHDWAQGRLAEEPMFDESPLGRSLHAVLLADRNRAWAGWLDERLDRPGTVLVAVGAGHFEGEDSLLDFLAERGLEAEQLD